jgi:hypothetical protein
MKYMREIATIALVVIAAAAVYKVVHHRHHHWNRYNDNVKIQGAGTGTSCTSNGQCSSNVCLHNKCKQTSSSSSHAMQKQQ